MSRLLVPCLLSAILVCGIGSAAFAQSSSLFGSSGPLSTTGNAAQRGLTNGLGGRQLGATGGLGTSGTGGLGGQSANPLGTQAGTTQLGQLSGTVGQGFVGRSENVGRLVGQRLSGQQGATSTNRNFRGVTNTGRTGRAGTTVGGTGGGGFIPGAQGGTGPQTTLRPVLRVAFRYPQRQATTIRTSVTKRLRELKLRQTRFSGVTATLDEGGEVVLRGTVASEETKTLAGNFVRLEPGVRSIRNELVVQSTASRQ